MGSGRRNMHYLVYVSLDFRQILVLAFSSMNSIAVSLLQGMISSRTD